MPTTNITNNFFNLNSSEIEAIVKAEIHANTPASTPIQTHSPIYLTDRKGAKIDIIRILNCLLELDFFTDQYGGKINKKQFFTELSNFLNTDFSTYQKNLSMAKCQAKADNANNLAIFRQLYQVQQRLNEV